MASKLEIDSLTIRNSGNIFSSTLDGNVGDFVWSGSYLYICVAENSWKRVAVSSWSAPDQVTGLTANSVGDTTIDLSWNAPSSDDPITDYIIEYTTGQNTLTVFVGSNTTSYQLTNLVTDSEYSIRVAAISSAGTGTYSVTIIATPVTLDPDAATYIAAVETADGQALEVGVKDAINAFVVGCKADGTFSALKASCILAGARTLSGALVPLVGTAPTNNNFVSADYDRKTGLVGDGSTKYLDTNRNNNADPQNNQHLSVYATTPNAGNRWYLGVGVTDFGSTHMYSNNDTQVGYRNRNASSNEAVTSNNAGLIAASRSSANSFVARNTSSVTVTRASQAPFNGNVFVFVSNGSTAAYSNARLSFYSIGESLDLAKLDTRVTTLMSDLAAAIP